MFLRPGSPATFRTAGVSRVRREKHAALDLIQANASIDFALPDLAEGLPFLGNEMDEGSMSDLARDPAKSHLNVFCRLSSPGIADVTPA